MDWRLRRPSIPVVDVALRARRDSLISAKSSSERRASIASFKELAPGFKYPVLEHIVMFKVKDDANPKEVAAMSEALHGLRKLDGVQELTVGTALSVPTVSSNPLVHSTAEDKTHSHRIVICESGCERLLKLSSSLQSRISVTVPRPVQGGDYTHVLHGRYRDRKALATFTAHPDYVKIVKKFLVPLTENIITVDWECKPYGPYLESIMAKRITLVKIKEGTSSEDLRFMEESIPRLPSKCPTIGQASAGTIFSSEKAKGFSYGILELFPSTEDEEEVFASVEHIAWQDTKLRPIAGSLLLADFHANG